jgi:hypothetical protein
MYKLVTLTKEDFIIFHFILWYSGKLKKYNNKTKFFYKEHKENIMQTNIWSLKKECVKQ